MCHFADVRCGCCKERSGDLGCDGEVFVIRDCCLEIVEAGVEGRDEGLLEIGDIPYFCQEVFSMVDRGFEKDFSFSVSLKGGVANAVNGDRLGERLECLEVGFVVCYVVSAAGVVLPDVAICY